MVRKIIAIDDYLHSWRTIMRSERVKDGRVTYRKAGWHGWMHSEHAGTVSELVLAREQLRKTRCSSAAEKDLLY